MTRRQFCQFVFQNIQHLALFQGGIRLFLLRTIGVAQALDPIQIALVIRITVTAQRRKEGCPQVANLAAAVKVADGVLQNALKQRRQLRYRSVAVALGQLEHGVLHDIQGIFLVMHGKPGRFIGPALDISEKSVQFARGGQQFAPDFEVNDSSKPCPKPPIWLMILSFPRNHNPVDGATHKVCEPDGGKAK